jgi:hypothetical protein
MALAPGTGAGIGAGCFKIVTFTCNEKMLERETVQYHIDKSTTITVYTHAYTQCMR